MITATDIKTIADVDPAHRVLNIGRYNKGVSSCGICSSAARIETLGIHCLGFGGSDGRSADIYNTIVVVYRCPACHERQWSHCAVEGGYYTYLRYLHGMEAIR